MAFGLPITNSKRSELSDSLQAVDTPIIVSNQMMQKRTSCFTPPGVTGLYPR
ncbi:6998_t:CDS:2 [Ambispora gerdemannii]|uniref:6998_t:CDS:1 n=1 Tax=Ambispora gerdemannii TaxID=144530 RepID=A0A9N9BEM0_9GLOM|nr:6998_t:CDS:2 [Ambispora gerdemannii]